MRQIGLRLDDDLLALVDQARGDVPREVFIRNAVSLHANSVANGRRPHGPLVEVYPEAFQTTGDQWPPPEPPT
jgi:hypothetical protein